MLANQGQAAGAVTVLSAVSAANTAAATSGWIDIRQYEGDLVFLVNTGAITGTNTITMEDATDGSGTGAAAIVPNEGNPTAVSTANQIRKFTINASAPRGWVRFIGTIVTGPNLIAVTLFATPKYT